jgi:drug/metabolite transporter (DMT)-like permease
MYKNIIKFSALLMSLGMILLVIWTSMQSDMFNLPEPVLKEPWFWTTIVDFYFNIAILSAWVIYREANWLRSLLWIVAFVILGSIATAFYVFLQIAALKQEEGIEVALLRRQ